jgi:hypothetical protein
MAEDYYVRIDDWIAKLTGLRETHGNLPVFISVKPGWCEELLDLAFVRYGEAGAAWGQPDISRPERILIG